VKSKKSKAKSGSLPREPLRLPAFAVKPTGTEEQLNKEQMN
jgi:hypothetical protein